MNFLTIDRIEDHFAVILLDDGSSYHMELSILPSGAKEGSVMAFDDEGNLCIDREEEKKRRNRNVELTKKLFNR